MHWKHKLCNSEGYSLGCFLVFITQINKSLGSLSLDSLLRGGRLIKSQELFLLNVEWIQYLSKKKKILRPVLATRDRVEDKTIKSVLNFMNFGEEMSFLLFSFYMYMLHFHGLERSLIALVRVGWVQDPCSFKNDPVNLSLIPLLDS